MCELTLIRDCDSGNTVLSNLFIDEYLADANDAQIKVYLYLIRMTNANRPTNISDIADRFNHTEKDVCRSLRYWEKKGLLSLDYDENGGIVGIRLYEPTMAAKQNQTRRMTNSFTPVMTVMPNVQPIKKEQVTNDNMNEYVKPSYTLDELKAFKSREETPQLIFVAEQYLKKTLSANDIRSIMFYTDVLGFSADLVDFLLQFCVQREKTRFAYIDTVAVDWAENNIKTVKQARNYCSKFDSSITVGSGKKNASAVASSKKRATTFHQFEQRDYDFDALEQQLLRQ